MSREMVKTKTTPRRIPPSDADYSSYDDLDLELEESEDDEEEDLSPESPDKPQKAEKEVKKTETKKKKLSEKVAEPAATKDVSKSPPKKRFVICQCLN